MNSGQRVVILGPKWFGSVISTTEEGWIWVQVDSTPGTNHRYLAEACELEETK